MVDWPLFIVECFVALGTLGLALFTMRLARSTKAERHTVLEVRQSLQARWWE